MSDIEKKKEEIAKDIRNALTGYIGKSLDQETKDKITEALIDAGKTLLPKALVKDIEIDKSSGQVNISISIPLWITERMK